MPAIKFGTSGWRGIIAEDFTFPNARLVCQAIADYLKQQGLASKGVVVGYDTRFQSETFAATAAEVMAGNGIVSYFTNRDCPTPVVSFAIRAGRRAGGINITASHNPAAYNGIKFSPATGGPAPEEVTKPIEALIGGLAPEAVKMLPLPQARERGLVVAIDPRQDYFQHLKTLVDTEVLRRAGLKVVVDVLYGTGRDYLDAFLRDAGVEVEVLHGWRDPYFGGQRPEPSAEFLSELAARIPATGAHLGLAVDADADRFGVMDASGEYYEANEILGLLLDYLIRTRGWEGGVARSVATTHLIDRVAKLYGRPVFETKVGFKYLGQYIISDQVDHGGGGKRRLFHEAPSAGKGRHPGLPGGGRDGGPHRPRDSRAFGRLICPGGAGLQSPPQLCADAGGQRAPDGEPETGAGLFCGAQGDPARHPRRPQIYFGRRQLGLFPPLRHRAGGAFLL